MTMWKKEATAFIVDTDTGDYLDFQYNPDDILDEKSAAYAAIKIPGMSHPRYQFVAGEPRRISFKIKLFKGSVKASVDWLRSLVYPEHSGTMLKNAPHRVLLVFGDLYPDLVCIVRQVKARFFNLFDRENLLPMQAEVDLVLEEYVDESIEFSDIRP